MNTDRRTRVLRFLRIAVSGVCLVACVLLVYTWVRSYRWASTVQGAIGTERIQLTSEFGRLAVYVYPNSQYRGYPDRSWTLSKHPPFGNRGPDWRFGMQKNRLDIALPYWLPILVSATAAAASWFIGAVSSSSAISWPKRFSLRTLLITVAIAAVITVFAVEFSTFSRSGFQIEQAKSGLTQIHFRFLLPASWNQFLTELRTVDLFGFHWQGTTWNLYVSIPYWFVICLGIAPAVVAWLRWPDRFSSRSVLRTAALVVAALGLVVFAAR